VQLLTCIRHVDVLLSCCRCVKCKEQKGLQSLHCKQWHTIACFSALSLALKRARRRSTASFRRKLFGHEQQEGFEDNIITQDQSMHNVRVHPLSAFKRYWDLAIVVMVAYTVVVLPVRCAFSWDYYHALDAGHNIFHQLAVRIWQ